jgi:hypothetical protein
MGLASGSASVNTHTLVTITLLHTHGRTVPRRVRAVMDWLERLLVPALDRLSPPR